MDKKVLKDVITIYEDFRKEFKIKDFPRLEDVLAVIDIESQWNTGAVSNKGAIGLMQLTLPALLTVNKIYETNYTTEDLKFYHINVWVGIRYLRWLWRAFEGVKDKGLRKMLTLMSYNWGIGNVMRWLKKVKTEDLGYIKKIVPAETKDYLIAFIGKHKIYENLDVKALFEDEVPEAENNGETDSAKDGENNEGGEI